MARNSAPPSATGGAGYNYADKVAAKYLLDMLAGRSAFGPEYGQIVRVDWETRDEATGWLVDDLRLTLRSGNTDRFVAVSNPLKRPHFGRGSRRLRQCKQRPKSCCVLGDPHLNRVQPSDAN